MVSWLKDLLENGVESQDPQLYNNIFSTEVRREIRTMLLNWISETVEKGGMRRIPEEIGVNIRIWIDIVREEGGKSIVIPELQYQLIRLSQSDDGERIKIEIIKVAEALFNVDFIRSEVSELLPSYPLKQLRRVMEMRDLVDRAIKNWTQGKKVEEIADFIRDKAKRLEDHKDNQDNQDNQIGERIHGHIMELTVNLSELKYEFKLTRKIPIPPSSCTRRLEEPGEGNPDKPSNSELLTLLTLALELTKQYNKN